MSEFVGTAESLAMIQRGCESTDFTHSGGPLVSVDGKPGPSIGARIRPWAKLNVRPRPLAAEDQAS